MATYYVRTSGSDTNAGTSPSTAFLTIQKGVTSTVSGDVVYVGAGVYRLSSQITFPNRSSATYLIGDTDGRMTGDAGEIVVTNYSSDTGSPAAISLMSFLSSRNWTVGKFTFLSGATVPAINMPGGTAGLALNFNDNIVYASSVGIYITAASSGFYPDVRIARCRIVSALNSAISISIAAPPTANINVLTTISNCVLMASSNPCIVMSGSPGTYFNTGVTIADCFMFGTYGVQATTAVWLNNTVAGCMIVAGNSLSAATTNQLIDQYNLHFGTLTNVTLGATSTTYASRSWRFSLGHESYYGDVTRPFGEFPFGSPLLNYNGYTTVTDDINGVSRPASGAGQTNTLWALGPFERSNSGTRDNVTYRTSAPSLKLTGAGYHDFEVPVSASPTTITAYVRRDATYAGVNPQIVLTNGGEAGVNNTGVEDTGAANTWNLLTIGPFTPTSAGIVTLRFYSFSSTATGTAWIDDISVS